MDSSSTTPWIVVTSGGMKYIGRVVMESAHLWGVAEPRQELIALLETVSRWVRLLPAYELHAPFVRDPQTGGIRRESLITHPDFILQNAKAPLHVHVDAFYFLDTLEEDDRAIYMRLIAKADEAITKALKGARGRSSHA